MSSATIRRVYENARGRPDLLPPPQWSSNNCRRGAESPAQCPTVRVGRSRLPADEYDAVDQLTGLMVDSDPAPLLVEASDDLLQNGVVPTRIRLGMAAETVGCSRNKAEYCWRMSS